jgi:hypothetical protein
MKIPMSTAWLGVAALSITVVPSSTPQADSSPSTKRAELHGIRHAPARHAIRDKTLLMHLYSLTGEHPLIGFLDPRTHTIYAAEQAIDRVKRALFVKETQGDTWIVEHRLIGGRYRFAHIQELDLKQPVTIGMAAVNEKSVCTPTPKGQCSNVYDENDNFAYSWKPPEDMFQCEWSDKQDCTDIWTSVIIKEYPKEDCNGRPKRVKEKVSTCIPN